MYCITCYRCPVIEPDNKLTAFVIFTFVRCWLFSYTVGVRFNGFNQNKVLVLQDWLLLQNPTLDVVVIMDVRVQTEGQNIN